MKQHLGTTCYCCQRNHLTQFWLQLYRILCVCDNQPYTCRIGFKATNFSTLSNCSSVCHTLKLNLPPFKITHTRLQFQFLQNCILSRKFLSLAAIPSLRARDCSKNEKEALNYLFLLVPLINVIIPFFWKSFAVVWSADTIAFLGMYAWKVSFISSEMLNLVFLCQFVFLSTEIYSFSSVWVVAENRLGSQSDGCLQLDNNLITVMDSQFYYLVMHV